MNAFRAFLEEREAFRIGNNVESLSFGTSATRQRDASSFLKIDVIINSSDKIFRFFEKTLILLVIFVKI
jgi:hypothetical protein